MPEKTPVPSQVQFVDTDKRLTVFVLIGGLLVGLFVWAATFLFHTYIFAPLMCQTTLLDTVCSDSTYKVAGATATILGAVAGILILVRLGAFRPLLVAIATAFTLWGIMGWVADASWYVAMLWVMGLYAIAYITYAWLARIQNFIAMVVVIIVVVILCRFVLSL